MPLHGDLYTMIGIIASNPHVIDVSLFIRVAEIAEIAVAEVAESVEWKRCAQLCLPERWRICI